MPKKEKKLMKKGEHKKGNMVATTQRWNQTAIYFLVTIPVMETRL